jgi:hypothetical protein
MKNNILKTLFVGIDVSSKTNVLCALDFSGNKLLNIEALNNQTGAETILAYKRLVYCLNPKTVANYRKSFIDMDKTDSLDAYVIADFARCGRITSGKNIYGI